jgi:hypothetical protein
LTPLTKEVVLRLNVEDAIGDNSKVDHVPGYQPSRLLSATVNRRAFFPLIGALISLPTRLVVDSYAQSQNTLLSAPLELRGDWGTAPPSAVNLVISRIREVCLLDLRLYSDQQPAKLRVDNHSSGYPAIWLHRDPADTAWIIVNIGPADWSKLAYQFGHELGHVLCNSWGPLAIPQLPSQWLEEALAEAFSLRGLALLADSWARNPPFAGDAAFATALRRYREDMLAPYRNVIGPPPDTDIASWFRNHRNLLDSGSGNNRPAVLYILAEFERDKAFVEDLGALNRWPSRSGVPIEEYLRLWDASCTEIRAPGRLPVRLRTLFKLG